MLQDLLGTQLDLPVRVGVAVVVIAVLLGLTVLIVRKLSGQAHPGAGKGRQARLAVLDSVAVDQRRRLVLVRRDEVEHLLLIGGASDVLVENGINRSAHRETLVAREATPVREVLPGRDHPARDALPGRDPTLPRRAPPLTEPTAPLGLEARNPAQDPALPTAPAIPLAEPSAPAPLVPEKPLAGEKAPIFAPVSAAPDAAEPDPRATPRPRPTMRSATDLFPRVSRTLRPADIPDISLPPEDAVAVAPGTEAPSVSVGAPETDASQTPPSPTPPLQARPLAADLTSPAADQASPAGSRPIPQPRRGVAPFPVGERDPRAPRTEPRIGEMASRLEASLGRSLAKPESPRVSGEGPLSASASSEGLDRPAGAPSRAPVQGIRVRPFMARPADRIATPDTTPSPPAERRPLTGADLTGAAALAAGAVFAQALSTAQAEASPASAEVSDPVAATSPDVADVQASTPSLADAPAPAVHGDIRVTSEPESAVAPLDAPVGVDAPADADAARSEPVFESRVTDSAAETREPEPELPPEPQLFTTAQPLGLDEGDLVRELEMTLALELASVEASGAEASEPPALASASDDVPAAAAKTEVSDSSEHAVPAPQIPEAEPTVPPTAESIAPPEAEPVAPEVTLSQMFEDAVLAPDDLLNADLTPPEEVAQPSPARDGQAAGDSEVAQAPVAAPQPLPEPAPVAAHDPFEDLEAEMASLLGRSAPTRT